MVGLEGVGLLELAVDGDAFVVPGPGDVGEAEAQIGDLDEGFEAGGAVVASGVFAVPEDAGVEEDGFVVVSDMLDGAEDGGVGGVEAVADDFEAGDVVGEALVDLVEGVGFEGVDPEERDEVG